MPDNFNLIVGLCIILIAILLAIAFFSDTQTF